MDIALVGAGRIGRVHARALRDVDGARLVAVSDPMEDAARAIAKAEGAEVREIDGMEGADVDAVLICSPTDTHADLIERFARAGKAVFCEKPIALDIGRTRKALAVVEETDTPLMIGFNRRFDPHMAAAKRSVEEGKVGEVESIQIVSRDPAPPPISYIQTSGGLFRDMAIHDFDMARWLLNEEPTTVSAHGSSLINAEIGRVGDVDTAHIILETASGRQASISNSRRATYGYDQRVEVHGSQGAIRVENIPVTNTVISGRSGNAYPPLHDFFMTRYAEAYRIEIAAFVRAAEAGDRPSPTGEDGLRALLLAEAAMKSMKEERRVSVEEVS